MIDLNTDKGETMRVSRQTRQTIDPAGRVVQETAAGGAPAAVSPVAPALSSERLAPAREALAAMPDVDLARVADVKAALARGEVRMDPERLAGAIRRFHEGRR
ncbi:flagellar biosynthesis anti-sigma factor FlgM [Paludibacterium paludis]|uniref:Negative regulator of flagellin synthesis n=1 Tax=Paludibacterium paludis TaxID=1225769 RepID=A0A918U7I0_9NEIS|nr:flagellar biosynthesis anti-sigma factor FlgM [Paludibacterium paludis]GGY04692.1 hypothetical protein GCM10011289_04030 [Paludibacterium paludis]